MRKNQTSLTAAGIAVMRAVESEKPEDERICYDHYARKIIPAWMYYVLGFFVPVDFNTHSLEERLLACGYDPTRRKEIRADHCGWLWHGTCQDIGGLQDRNCE